MDVMQQWLNKKGCLKSSRQPLLFEYLMETFFIYTILMAFILVMRFPLLFLFFLFEYTINPIRHKPEKDYSTDHCSLVVVCQPVIFQKKIIAFGIIINLYLVAHIIVSAAGLRSEYTPDFAIILKSQNASVIYTWTIHVC